MSRDKILHDSWSISRGVKWCVPGSSLGRHLESGVDPGNEVDGADASSVMHLSIETPTPPHPGEVWGISLGVEKKCDNAPYTWTQFSF